MVAIKNPGIAIMKNYMLKDYVKIAISLSTTKYSHFISFCNNFLKLKKRSYQKILNKSSEKNNFDGTNTFSNNVKIEYSEINVKKESIE